MGDEGCSAWASASDVRSGGDAEDAFEMAGEVALIEEADACGDFGALESLVEEALGGGDAEFDLELVGGGVRRFGGMHALNKLRVHLRC